ncbi:MAG: hypothetical protein PHD32_07445 [Eubacteriales bacterium]|nr:hypothetical protein [Eubacteriales bacterium]
MTKITFINNNHPFLFLLKTAKNKTAVLFRGLHKCAKEKRTEQATKTSACQQNKTKAQLFFGVSVPFHSAPAQHDESAPGVSDGSPPTSDFQDKNKIAQICQRRQDKMKMFLRCRNSGIFRAIRRFASVAWAQGRCPRIGLSFAAQKGNFIWFTVQNLCYNAHIMIRLPRITLGGSQEVLFGHIFTNCPHVPPSPKTLFHRHDRLDPRQRHASGDTSAGRHDGGSGH